MMLQNLPSNCRVDVEDEGERESQKVYIFSVSFNQIGYLSDVMTRIHTSGVYVYLDDRST